MKKPDKKREQLYIVRKYIKAQSAQEAILKDKKTPVQDVWVDDEWKKNNPELTPAIGFSIEDNTTIYDDVI